jgi:hypothetical protein
MAGCPPLEIYLLRNAWISLESDFEYGEGSEGESVREDCDLREERSLVEGRSGGGFEADGGNSDDGRRWSQ